MGTQARAVSIFVAAREAIAGMGLPDCYADAHNEYYRALSVGPGDFTANYVDGITGHPARSYETVAHAFAPTSVSAS